jgi:hypothetical protein
MELLGSLSISSSFSKNKKMVFNFFFPPESTCVKTATPGVKPSLLFYRPPFQKVTPGESFTIQPCYYAG